MKYLIRLCGLLCLGWASTGLTIDYPMPEKGNDIIGQLQQAETRYEDTFSDIARLHDLGYREMVSANPGIDPWLPGVGAELVLPSQFILPPGPRKGVVINLPELRIYYYSKDGKTVTTHPLGIGRDGWNTPVGTAKVTRKKEGPTWTPPASIRAEHAAKGDILPEVVQAGPDNPLGTHAIYLSLPGSYLLHGTNKPFGVGMRVSHGCIRLYPEDIASIFTKIPVGAPVSIINEPYKAGWVGDQLFVEAHPSLVEGEDDEGQLQDQKVNITPMMRVIVAALGEKDNVEINWQGISSITQSALGFPLPIGKRIIEPPKIEVTQVVDEDKMALDEKLEQSGQLKRPLDVVMAKPIEAKVGLPQQLKQEADVSAMPVNKAVTEVIPSHAESPNASPSVESFNRLVVPSATSLSPIKEPSKAELDAKVSDDQDAGGVDALSDVENAPLNLNLEPKSDPNEADLF